MLRVFQFTSLLLFSCLAHALPNTPSYQVDMIVFTHLQSSLTPVDGDFAPLLAPDTNHAIPLQTTSDRMTPYHILPTSASDLRKEFWALSRKPQYQILFHYTWIQPGNNQRPVALSQLNTGGWNVEGTLRIRRSNYYLLDTELLFSAPNSTQTAFIFSQKKRLKPGVVYYLDHPQAGMLIKVHQIA